ncbi:MAG: FecR family protein [Bacteroidales bacterium]|nr:FecR family protein [Bacteroidales bacterium]
MDPSIKKICFDFFAGDTDEEMAGKIQDFLSGSKENEALFKQWEQEWYSENVPSFSQLNSFSSIKRDINSRKKMRIVRWTGVVAAAACAILLAILFIPSAKVTQPDSEEMLCIVETGFREKTKVILPDSTQVWLNSASRISYNKDFLEGDRLVRLEGEAYFDVKKYGGRKFTVDLGESKVNVLGTKFNVSSYKKENLCEVSLMEGSVEFTTPGTKVEMIPGETLTLDLGRGEMEKHKGDASKGISWMENKLDYTKISLERLLQRLSSIYGIDIRYTPDKNAGSTFGVILNLDEGLPNILDGLTLIQPVRWYCNPDGSICVTTVE